MNPYKCYTQYSPRFFSLRALSEQSSLFTASPTIPLKTKRLLCLRPPKVSENSPALLQPAVWWLSYKEMWFHRQLLYERQDKDCVLAYTGRVCVVVEIVCIVAGHAHLPVYNTICNCIHVRKISTTLLGPFS